MKQIVFVSGSLGPIDSPHLCGRFTLKWVIDVSIINPRATELHPGTQLADSNLAGVPLHFGMAGRVPILLYINQVAHRPP